MWPYDKPAHQPQECHEMTQITVASETLEGVFLVNNSMNIHHRTLKPSAMIMVFL